MNPARTSRKLRSASSGSPAAAVMWIPVKASSWRPAPSYNKSRNCDTSRIEKARHPETNDRLARKNVLTQGVHLRTEVGIQQAQRVHSRPEVPQNREDRP